MANDFSSDSDVKAVWRFEPGGLTTDSQSTNHLTVLGSPTSCTTDYIQGTGCVKMNCGGTSGQAFYINDADLATGFPLKSGDSVKSFMWSCWFKLDYIPEASRYIMGKWGSTGTERSFALYVEPAANLKYAYATSSSGAQYGDIYTGLQPGVWYWCGLMVEGVTVRQVRAWYYNSSTQTLGFAAPSTQSADLYVGNGKFCVGCIQSLNGSFFPGLIDEVVVRNTPSTYKQPGSAMILDVIREGRYSGSGDTVYVVDSDPTSDTTCQGYWAFEPGGLTTDAMNLNHLTASASSPTSNTTAFEYFEGSGSATFVDTSSQYFYRDDSDLSANFPLKSTDTTKKGTWCCWFRPTTIALSGDYNQIISKWDDASKRCLMLMQYNSNVFLYYGYNNGLSTTTKQVSTGTLDVNTWYFVAVAFDGVAQIVQHFFFGYFRKSSLISTWNVGQTLSVTTAPFAIGCNYNTTAQNFFPGQIDGVHVFNRMLTVGEMAALMKGEFSDVHQSLMAYKIGAQIAYRANDDRNIWCINPSGVYTADRSKFGVGGNAYQTGQSWDQALQTWKSVVVPPNDIMLCRKSDETAQSMATAAATTGSRVVSTTADMTSGLAQYDIIRFNDDAALYSIRAITSSVISLYRPYRGTTSAGKTVNKLLLFPTYNDELNFITISPVAGQTVDCRCGVDMDTNTQTGFSVFDTQAQSSYDGFESSQDGWKLSRFGFNYGDTPFYINSVVNGELENCYAFRSGAISVLGLSKSVKFREVIAEGAAYFNITNAFECEFDDCEQWPGNTSTYANLSSALSCIFRRFHQGHGECAFRLIGAITDTLFVDCDFGTEQANNTCDLYFTSGSIFINNLWFRNCLFQSTNLFYHTTGPNYSGAIYFESFNRSPTDHRKYVGRGFVTTATGTNVWSCLVSRDDSVYRTAAPSVKVAFNSTLCETPVKESFVVPVDADVYRTVTVFVRKNGAYGGQGLASTLPFMTVKYPTLSSGTTVWSEVYATMPDTVDTWSQLSAGVTPCMKGAIEIELCFWSRNDGAIAWYDDFSVG